MGGKLYPIGTLPAITLKIATHNSCCDRWEGHWFTTVLVAVRKVSLCYSCSIRSMLPQGLCTCCAVPSTSSSLPRSSHGFLPHFSELSGCQRALHWPSARCVMLPSVSSVAFGNWWKMKVLSSHLRPTDTLGDGAILLKCGF